MDILDIFKTGGFVMFPLLFISITNLSLFINLITTFHRIQKDFKTSQKEPRSDFAKEVMKAKEENFKENWEKKIEPNLFAFERKSLWISHLASLSTLLGLLGTVIGIYIAFQNMKISGKASIEVFADGIGQALITTIFGLVIAIPSNFLYYILKHLLDEIEIIAYNFQSDETSDCASQ